MVATFMRRNKNVPQKENKKENRICQFVVRCVCVGGCGYFPSHAPSLTFTCECRTDRKVEGLNVGKKRTR